MPNEMPTVNNLNTDRPPIVTQPHLGEFKENYKPGDNIGGQISLAKIIAVHHKHNTVDVQIVKTSNNIVSIPNNEGKLGARVCVPTAHFCKNDMVCSGVVEPLQIGQLVVLAFLDNTKSQPIVLGSVHDTWNTENNILSDIYPLEPIEGSWQWSESLKYLRMFPSQVYFKVNGMGGVEFSHSSCTFLKIDNGCFAHEEALMQDGREDFDHEDMSEKDYFGAYGTIRGQKEMELLPVSVLFGHRSHYNREITTWTKIWISPQGAFRLTRDNHKDNLAFIEVDEEGKITHRVQQDSFTHYEGDKYTQSVMDIDGSYRIERVNIDEEKDTRVNTVIKMTEEGVVTLDSTSRKGETAKEIGISISAEQGIVITDKVNGTITLNNEGEPCLENAGSLIKLCNNGDIIIRASGKIVMSPPITE